MNKKIYLSILLLAIIFGTAIIATNSKSATATIENTKQIISSWFMTEKGELFLLNPGESEEIVTQHGKINVKLIEIAHNPEEISDLAIDYVEFSNDNPEPGEQIHITVSITNIGTGISHGAEFKIIYGDEGQGNQGGSIIVEIQPEETVILEFDHTYEEEGYYTVTPIVNVANDINTGNNVACEEIKVGDPQDGGSGGCMALPQQIIPKDAHILYTVYDNNIEIGQEELWLNTNDIGSLVEVLKLSDSQALLTVPM